MQVTSLVTCVVKELFCARIRASAHLAAAGLSDPYSTYEAWELLTFE